MNPTQAPVPSSNKSQGQSLADAANSIASFVTGSIASLANSFIPDNSVKNSQLPVGREAVQDSVPPADNSLQTQGTEASSLEALTPRAGPVTLRQVSMPADPQKETLTSFPFGVNYNLCDVPVEGQGKPLTEDTVLKFALRNAINSRQGVFEWLQQGKEGLRSQLETALSSGESIELGDGVIVHSLSEPEIHGSVRQYQLVVTAPAMDVPGETDTFEVPFTELHVSEDRLLQADWVTDAELAMQTHLFNVDIPYQDSVETPLVLNRGCNELADMHALHTEISSRIHAGLIRSEENLANTLQSLAPEFVPVKHAEAPRVLLQTLTQQFAAVSSMNVRAQPNLMSSKRYFVKEPDPKPGLERPSTTDELSDYASDDDEELLCSTSTTRHPSTAYANEYPVQSKLTTESSISASANQQLVESETFWDSAIGLTLTGHQPSCTPSLQRAFMQIGPNNHCGIAAVNNFFQAPVLSSAQAVNQIMESYTEAVNVFNDNWAELQLPGLYHPRVLAAMGEGRGIVMSKNEFVGVEGMADPGHYPQLYNEQPLQQWAEVLKYQRRGWHNREEAEITPDNWISASKGIHLDCLNVIVNQFLVTKADKPEWGDYPDHVTKISMSEADMPDDLEACINRLIENRENNGSSNKQFPMICMINGHYFTVARTKDGDWIKLDSFQTHQTGVHRDPPLFARAGNLAQKLRDSHVIHVLCEPLPLLEQHVS